MPFAYFNPVNLFKYCRLKKQTKMFSIFVLLFFIQFNTISTIDQNKNVRLEISPRMPQINLAEGEKHLLTCSGGGQEPTFFTNLKWFDPKGQEINSNNEFYGTNYNIKHKQGSVFLSFINPTENLSGNYTCRGLFQNVYELSESIQVAFYHDITWQGSNLMNLIFNKYYLS